MLMYFSFDKLLILLLLTVLFKYTSSKTKGFFAKWYTPLHLFVKKHKFHQFTQKRYLQ